MAEHSITPDQAAAAYDILVAHDGAYDGDKGRARESFILAVTNPKHPCDEYRFCGSLGFGGKVRRNHSRGGIPYVDCYREHEMPERLAAIERVNGLLARLFAEVSSPLGSKCTNRLAEKSRP